MADDIISIVITEQPTEIVVTGDEALQVVATNFYPIANDVPATSSFAVSASFATTASYAANVPATSSYAISASHALNADNATSASNVLYNNIGQKPTLFSGSSQVQLNQINGTTFANADFVFPANISVLGTATVNQLYTLYETSSIIYASGSTKFGDTSDDTHQFTGSVSILGTTTSTQGFTGSLQGNAATATSASYASTYAPVTAIYEEIVAGENLVKGDPLYISGSQGSKPVVYKADAAVASKMPVTFIAFENVNQGLDTLGIVLGLISGIDLTGYNVGDEVYVAAGGGWTATRPTGSVIVQLLGIITKAGNGGKGLVLNPGPVDLPNLNSGSVWVGNGNSVPVAVTTSSLVNGKDIFPANVYATNIVSASNIISANSASIANNIIIRNGGLKTSSTNIAIGNNALSKVPNLANTTGSVAIGENAMSNVSLTTQAGANVAIGFNAFASGAFAVNTVAIGAFSMASASANSNTAVGHRTLMSASAVGNNAFGNFALSQLQVGTNNSGYGTSTFTALQSGSANAGFGSNVAATLRSGSNNTFVGAAAAAVLVSGSENTSIGRASLNALRSGSNNIAIGANAALYINSGSNDLFINSINRNNIAGDYSSSIIYGRQSEVASGQVLRLNAQVIAPYGITGSVESASFATTSSFANNTISSSFATTASFALNAVSTNPFPLSGSAIITGSLKVSGSGTSTPSTTPVDLNGLLWSGSYNNSSIIPGAVSASDLGSQSNPFRNAYFSGFISASSFVGYTGSGSPPPPLILSSSFTYNASSIIPVTGTSSSLSGLHDQIKACVMSSSGEVLYYLNSTNWTQKADTTPSTLNGDNQHVMIEIPKFYWTASQAGSGATRSVKYDITYDASSTGSSFNFQLHPAFYKSGSVVDKRYISAYLACGRSGSVIYTGTGSLDTGSAANQLASISGSAPLHTRSKTSFRQLANNIGNGWGIHEIYLQNAIELLYLSEYQTLNSQTAIGVGNGSTSASAGLSNAYANGSTPTGYVGSCRYRGIENLWGVNAQWLDGILLDTILRAYVSNDQRYFGDYISGTTLSNYVRITGSITQLGSGDYWDDYYEYNNHKLSLIIPNSYGGSSTTRFTDYGYSPSIYPEPSGSYSMGGNGTGSFYGMWYREVEKVERADQYYGTRITY